ncbi:hypothetical protein TNCT_172741 [Trichonephila clavata]|uniref:Uncharacterized protein n=1 Tax=Trichonephila clavata TaxID=2740835 RepID=A0A8X6LGZ8_TRICU|nr:hypothetical protein TNCT_172741 [Trichonephila clavata]
MECEKQESYQSSSENATPPQNHPKAPQTSPLNLSTKSSFEFHILNKRLTDIANDLSKRDEETGEIIRSEYDAVFYLLDSVESKKKTPIKSKNPMSDEDSVTNNKNWHRNSTESLPNIGRLSFKCNHKINSGLFRSDILPEIFAGRQEFEIDKHDSNFISKLNPPIKKPLNNEKCNIATLASNFSDISMDDRFTASDSYGKTTDFLNDSGLLTEDISKLSERIGNRKSQNKKRVLSFDEGDFPSTSCLKKVTKNDFTGLLNVKKSNLNLYSL